MQAGEYRAFRVTSALVAALVILLALVLLLEIDRDFLPYIELVPLLGVYADLVRSGIVAVVVIAAVWLVLRASGYAFERFAAPKVGSHAYARSVWKVFAYVVWAIVLLALTVALVGGLAFAALSLGLLGAALAFVLQKPLLNIVGWASITWDRIYRIGDRVAIGDVRGYVTDIRVMHTELREFGGWMKGDTFSGRIVIVPNGLVFDTPVHNYTRDIPFVWDEIETLVTYESDIDTAKQILLDSTREVVGSFMEAGYQRYLRRLELRDLEGLMLREPETRLDFADSGVRIYVIYFGPAAGRRRIRSQIYEKIWRRVNADPRVQIAYPHMEIVRHPSWKAGGDDHGDSSSDP